MWHLISYLIFITDCVQGDRKHALKYFVKTTNFKCFILYLRKQKHFKHIANPHKGGGFGPINKFFYRNRSHVTLRVFSPEILFNYQKFKFDVKKLKLLIDSNSPPWWRLVTWIQICASLHHRKVKKAEPSRLVSWKFEANLEFLIAF